MSWDRLARQLGPSAGLPGIDAVSFSTQLATFATVSNQANYLRFVAPRTLEIDRIEFAVQTADTADTQCDAGIFDGNSLVKLGSSGATSGLLNGPANKKTLTLASPAALVGTSADVLGVAASFWLPEPPEQDLPD